MGDNIDIWLQEGHDDADCTENKNNLRILLRHHFLPKNNNRNIIAKKPKDRPA